MVEWLCEWLCERPMADRLCERLVERLVERLCERLCERPMAERLCERLGKAACRGFDFFDTPVYLKNRQEIYRCTKEVPGDRKQEDTCFLWMGTARISEEIEQ